MWIFTIVPEFLMRFLSWVLVRTLYRLRARGIEEHVPDEGPALLVCNHVSYMDALILAASIPRPVRFVMYYKIFNIPVMRWIFRTAKAIPIAGAREDPELMQRAFDEIDAALAERRDRRHLPRRRADEGRRDRAVQIGRRTHPAAPPGARRADGAARHVDEHVEPARRPPAAHARAAPLPRARGSRRRAADRRPDRQRGIAGGEGAGIAGRCGMNTRAVAHACP